MDKDIQTKCKKHDYHIVETSDTGYIEQCSVCDDFVIFDVNDTSGAKKLILFAFGLAIIFHIVNWMFNLNLL